MIMTTKLLRMMTSLGPIRTSDNFVCCRENVAPRNMIATISRQFLIRICIADTCVFE